MGTQTGEKIKRGAAKEQISTPAKARAAVNQQMKHTYGNAGRRKKVAMGCKRTNGHTSLAEARADAKKQVKHTYGNAGRKKKG